MAIRYQLYADIENKDGSKMARKSIKRILDDGTISSIPMDSANTDYQAYLEWAKTTQRRQLINGINTIKTAAIADDAVTADKLANAINTERTANTAKSTNATHTGEVTGSGALTITDDTVDEANLKISNAGSNGQFLQNNLVIQEV